jgi:hypothetical protein
METLFVLNAYGSFPEPSNKFEREGEECSKVQVKKFSLNLRTQLPKQSFLHPVPNDLVRENELKQRKANPMHE